MTSSDPFMTLVDVATALIDDSKTKQGEIKTSLSVQLPKVISNTIIPQETTPPPPDFDSEVEVVLVSPATPGTPTASNRTKKNLKADNSSFQLDVLHKKPISFARMLMKVLMDESLHDIITFLPDGDAFAILKPKTFAEEVMPKYFAIRTFSPMVRKLHRWGFERIMDKKTHDVDVFRHPLFIRGNFMLCDKIKCVGRLVKGPVEESILAAAGINNKSMGMPTHQELEIRRFVELTSNPMMRSAPTSTTSEMLLQAARQSSLLQQAPYSFIQQANRQARSSFRQEAQLRQAAEAQQTLQKQVTDSAAVNQMLLASLNKNREKECRVKEESQRFTQEDLLRQEVANALQQQHQQMILTSLNKNREEERRSKEELQRLTQEELLRQEAANALQQQYQQLQKKHQQQLSSEVPNAWQQARLRELLTVPSGGSQVNNGSLPMSLVLRAALENQSGRAVDPLAALRHYF